MKEGLAGKIAKSFIGSKLTVLLMIVFMVVGVYSSFLIPREEEPQIDVPMADIFVGYPGASPTEVESRIIKPLEKLISNIKGVEYVYSTAMKEKAMVIVQFYVGEDIERSFVKLYNEINKHMDQMPQGVTMPLVKTRAIDDVPMLGLTLWSENYDDYQIKQIADELTNEIEKVNDVAITHKIGGRNRQLRVVLDKDKLSASGLDFLSVSEMIKANNQQLSAGSITKNDTEFLITTGKFLESVEDVNNLVVGVQQNQPIYLKQIATIIDGPEIPSNYVSLGFGQASEKAAMYTSEYQAVTISVAKRKGADAMKISDVIINKVEHLRTTLIPDDVHVEVTRNYGETASQKVSELLMHLIGAIIAVTLVVMLAMGWRGGLVVFLSVPVTFALTLLSYYMLDYTLNRITLFALVFVTGIVVDDSIIIAENMHRHFKMKRLPFKQAALYAINEVGNPTILATFTVIASVLPMAFVSGLMGPYMSPMPIGASIAMLLSLFVALTITPYLGFVFLREKDKKRDTVKENESRDLTDTFIYRVYSKFEIPLIENRAKRWLFLGITFLLLLGSVGLFFTKSVAVKMLPFDNKNEFQVVIDMPEGTTLERTAVVAKEIAQYLSSQPEVVNYQNYVGTSAPITFNGLVRHYDLRGGSNMADIQVNLTDKHDRSLQSHDIAKMMRPDIQEIAQKYNANVKLVEVPPGPPVLSTIVAEVYGPNYDKQIEVANEVQDILKNTTDVVDIDWMVEDDQIEYEFIIDKEKAMLYGVAPQQIAYTMNMALSNSAITNLYDEDASNQVAIVVALDEKEKSTILDISQLKIKSQRGVMIAISDLVTIQQRTLAKSIYRKNQKRVVYVMADMAGELESPVYAILGISDKLQNIALPIGYKMDELYIKQPDFEEDYTVKWDGEWQITLEVFRDLGIAFLGVIIIIYILIVGWFQNFKAPVVMMVAIPLSLVGIVLGHWVMGAFFTATSFIGMIALAGIMVRNSVLLIDFVNLRLAEGVPIKQAVIEAGAVRTTPILLTAGTVVIGAFVILFDPIFQGLAISLMGGTIVSTVLTLLVVPLVYYMIERKNYK
ncbi:multidrug efflux pump subunit AcrB [Aquimarina sp. MAR_2010_214]|uniref:efflux RND transporter permease subunit n=1 Tax=Aquimarina sp. MAR_2010_214 TaxID=1250026 RepID=UPI000C70CDAE|nr:efflux RND transporter permease subunit [Aquimarina sp. MAR_2010_214]PKV48371.1 multidrug efflux pump subunit AcrB [Aquimarina sp. MAR_2010_214]